MPAWTRETDVAKPTDPRDTWAILHPDTPQATRDGRVIPSLRERLHTRIDRSAGDDACWPWQGAPDSHGYGLASYDDRVTRVTRIMFRLEYGHWPDPMCRHTCDNPPCTNPRHLLAGTASQNVQDSVERGRHSSTARKQQTHCKQGHAFTPENTYINPTTGQRVCRDCMRVRSREYYQTHSTTESRRAKRARRRGPERARQM